MRVRLESLESRLLMARQSIRLGDAELPAEPPGQIQLFDNVRAVAGEIRAGVAAGDDFLFSSSQLNEFQIGQLNAGESKVSDQFEFYRPTAYQTPTFSEQGYLVARRQLGDTDLHSMVVARASNDCFGVEGIYTRPRHHYMISFDVRHPKSEQSWLDHHDWAVVMQLWGPREPGETGRNPPLALYTKSVDGELLWTLASRGDARRTTQTGQFQDAREIDIPYNNVGAWNRWDVEYVPDPTGQQGMVRAWLNGQLVAQWKGLKTGYYSYVHGEESGPLNPGFGLYSPLAEDDMEVHFDNMSIRCNGPAEQSFAGVVRNAVGQLQVSMISKQDNRSYDVVSHRNGVFAVNVPPGNYDLLITETASQRSFRDTVLVSPQGNYVQLNLNSAPAVPTPPPPPPSTPTPNPPSPPTPPTTGESFPVPAGRLVGDVDADGRPDVIHHQAGGTLRVTSYSQGHLTNRTWGSIPTDQAWTDINTGDFDGDGRADVAARNDRGHWWVWRSTGENFAPKYWGLWSVDAQWDSVLVGDFNGDGRDDLLGRASDGRMWQAAAGGFQFTTTLVDRWDASVPWVDVTAADFDGDGRVDVAGRDSRSGWWWISYSKAHGWQGKYAGRWSAFVAWQDVMAADLTGDGLADLVGRGPDGRVWLAPAQPNGTLGMRPLAVWDDSEDWLDAQAADVDKDGVLDLVARARSTGRWWATKVDPTSPGVVAPQPLAVGSPPRDDREYYVADLDGDGRLDAV